MRRATLRVLVLFIGLGSALVPPILAEPSSTFSLSMHNQRFSAHIIHVPLEKVLDTLTSHIPIRFVIDDQARQDPISVFFTHLTLEKTLERLLIGHDYAIMTHRDTVTPEASKILYRTEVEIISRTPAAVHSNSNGHNFMANRRTSIPPMLVKATPIFEMPGQEQLIALDPESDASDFQATLQEALKEENHENSALLADIMQKLETTKE